MYLNVDYYCKSADDDIHANRKRNKPKNITYQNYENESGRDLGKLLKRDVAMCYVTCTNTGHVLCYSY